MMENSNLGRREPVNRSETDLKEIFRHHEVHNRTEGKSERTVEWYQQALGQLYQWLVDEERPTTVGSIDEMVVREFILHFQGRRGTKGPKVSSHTIYNRVNALRAFFAWVHAQGYTETHILAGMRQPKTTSQIVEPLEPQEISQIFEVINPNTALGSRNTALVSLMLDTGLRVSEVADLKEDDVHVEQRYLKAMGKGSKERIVPFGSSCQRALISYYHRFRVEPAHDDVDGFFLSIDGYGMGTSGVQSYIKRLSRASGIKRLHPHLLRHTYATMFLLNGGDIFLLKQNLGHTSLAMVENYVHLASRIAAVRSQGFSPLDRVAPNRGRRYGTA